jgi:hypothetical protein
MRHALPIALIGFSVSLAVLASYAQHRVALVIGNSTYSNVEPPTAPGPGSGPLAGNPTLQLSQNKPTPPAPTADLLVEDVPLPRNVSVSNPQNVPEDFKRFSGAWVGAWGGRLHHILIVESITADGTANIVYAVGDSPWQRPAATIVGNTLRVERFATYELTGNGQLDATYEGSNGHLRATMSRIELADLTRPGTTISQWPPADLLVEDVPLPRNVSVSNPQNVPEDFKRFSGAWVGAWGGRLHHILIVESITADGTANIVYAVGDNPAANVRRQWQRRDATIVGNTLRVERFATYELTGNGLLDATFEPSNGRSRATMSRIELADLTRPGATISQWPTPPAPATALLPSPLVARAQQRAMPVIGFLDWANRRTEANPELTAFRQGLASVGFVENQNVAIEFREANGQLARLPMLAAELVRRGVSVMVVVGSRNGAYDAKRATSTIPIVFAYGGDPVRDGIVASLNRPGSNITGVTPFNSELGGKRLIPIPDQNDLAM